VATHLEKDVQVGAVRERRVAADSPYEGVQRGAAGLGRNAVVVSPGRFVVKLGTLVRGSVRALLVRHMSHREEIRVGKEL
jgi:hypothetical protein